MKIEITGLDALAKSIDNLSIALVSLKFPRQVSVVKAETVTTTEAPPVKKKRAAKKKRAVKETPAPVKEETPIKETPVKEETPAPVEETPIEVVPDTERTEEEVTTKAKEIIAKFSPVELRTILDATVGVGIKISTAPKEKYATVYDALVAKLSAGSE